MPTTSGPSSVRTLSSLQHACQLTGNFTGPAELLAKRTDFDDGKCTREDLKVVEDKAIREAVKMQQEVGIKAITDGEFRRHMCVLMLSDEEDPR